MPRVLVIGLDGATFDLVDPWVKAGHLPNLTKLMQEGSYGNLRSVMPVLSSAAWSSFMTGLNPGNHGVYDFARRDPDTNNLRVVNRTHIHGSSLWRLAGQQGLKSVVVNVPMTYPPEEINGIMITGLGTPNNKTFTYPGHLSKQLRQKGYAVNKLLAYKPGREKAFLKEVYDQTQKMTELCLELIHKEPWDFFMVVYRDTDELSHYYWRFMDSSHPWYDPDQKEFKDAILDYYKYLDKGIGELVSEAGDGVTVIIVSDHGGGPLYRDVLLNEWLKQKRYLKLKMPEGSGEVSKRILSRLGITRSNISIILRRLKLSRLETWIKDLFGDRIDLLPKTTRAEFPAAIDWSKSSAYSFGYHGQIYINKKFIQENSGGRPESEVMDELMDKITQELYGMVDPTDHKKIVDRVYRKEEIYSGPYLNDAADLTIVMRNFSYITRLGYEFGSQPGEIFTSPSTFESGSHRMEGMIIVSGADAVKHEGYFEEANLIDVMPTVLYLLGCSIPKNVDGKILKNWIAMNRPVIFHQEDGNKPATEENEIFLDKSEEEEMVERLKGLGYLD